MRRGPMVELPSLIRWILFSIPAALYGLAVQVRLWLYRWKILTPAKLHSPIISIGNLTVGGTGKTPIVELVARLLKAEGESVVILSRGYKADDTTASHRVSDRTQILVDWREAGDEPFQLARNLPGVPVYIGKSRYNGGRQAEDQEGASVFVLDDGYQHIQLERNFNILLIDATDPFGGGWLLPLGRLREGVREIRRADIIIITRSDHPFDEESITRVIRKYKPSVHLLFAYYDVVGLRPVQETMGKEILVDPEKDLLDVRDFAGERVVAMSGIARPELFVYDIRHFQIQVAEHFSFPDHHRYTQAEIDSVINAAHRQNARAIFTTEKDAIRMAHLNRQDMPFYYLRIQARVEDEGRLKFYLDNALGRFGS